MTDWESEGMLEGLQSEAERSARRELLDRLADDGCTVEELRQAITDDRLALLPFERLLTGDRRYTFEDAAEMTGLSLDYLQRNWRAIGLPEPDPDEPSHTEQNIEGMRGIKAALDAGVSEEDLLELTRLVGDAASKLADASLRTFGSVLLQPGDTERDYGLRLTDMANVMMPTLGALLEGPYKAHLAETLRHEAIGHVERERGEVPGARPVAICFADLVGFTSMSEQLDVDELGAVTRRFSDLTAEVIEPPVKLVKTIGDEAMLASEEPAPLVGAALELIAAVDRDDVLPPLRAGAAAGDALRRAGDWYGRPVNLAARITAVADEGALTANADLREAAGDSFSWTEAGRREFKGLQGEVELFRAQRA